MQTMRIRNHADMISWMIQRLELSPAHERYIRSLVRENMERAIRNTNLENYRRPSGLIDYAAYWRSIHAKANRDNFQLLKTLMQ